VCKGLLLSLNSPNLFNHTAEELPSMNRIKPNDHLNSYLWRKIDNSQGAVGGCGKPMPYPNGGLSPADITAIQNWIDSGAVH